MSKYITKKEVKEIVGEAVEGLSAVIIDLGQGVYEGLARLRGDVSGLKDGQVAIGATMTELQQGQARLERSVAELQDDVAELQAGHAKLDGDLTVLKEDLSGLRADVAKVKTDLSGLKTDVAQLHKGQTKLVERIDKIIKRLDGNQPDNPAREAKMGRPRSVR